MAGFVEVLGFDAVEQKTIDAAFSFSLRRKMVYAKWRPGTAPPNIVLFDGDNRDVLKEIFSRSFDDDMALVAVSQQPPALITCFHVERPIRYLPLLQALDDGMRLSSDHRQKYVHSQFGDTTMPGLLEALSNAGVTVLPNKVNSKPVPLEPKPALPSAVAAAAVPPAPAAAPPAAVERAVRGVPAKSVGQRLPLAPDLVARVSPPALCILVVDDNRAVRQFVATQLASLNIDVHYAENGEQAIVLTETKRYDCVFLDVVMPGMDGYQVCKRVKARRTGPIPRVVMLTGQDGVFDKIRGKMAGCDAYLTKPVAPQKLLDTLARLVPRTLLASKV